MSALDRSAAEDVPIGSAPVIYYVATERHMRNTRRFLRVNPEMKKVMATLSYEELFFQRGGPVGHYIFTDHDRLTRFELDCVSLFCDRLRAVAPDARQLNHPARVKDRFPLLVELSKAGINSFHATRVETGERPPEYPVFIRSEDGCRGPETDLIYNDDEYDLALEDLKTQGKTRRGRIALGYAAQAGPDGLFRKYAAYRIGGDILPHHIQRGNDWIVKRDMELSNSSGDFNQSDNLMQEELDFVKENPHQGILRRAFEIADTEYGRIDYGIVNGRVEVYEINTNPQLPRSSLSDPRDSVREVTSVQISKGFKDIDAPIKTKRHFVRFSLPRPMDHKFRIPVRYFPRAIWRKVCRLLGR